MNDTSKNYLNLNIIVVALAATLLFILNTVSAEAQQHKMPRGSFLKKPVHSVAELIQAVHTDPVVSSRFTRLFNMSPQMVRLAFGKMHLARMKADSVRKVYYVHAGEQIGYRILRVKKGTLVFAYSDGTPILLQVCGNALRPVSPAALSAMPRVRDYSEHEELGAVSSLALASNYPLRNAAPEYVAARNSVQPPPPDFVMENTAVPYNQPAPSFHEVGSPSVLRGLSSGQLIGWVAGGALVGALVTGRGGSGSSSSSVITSGSGSGSGAGAGTIVNIVNNNSPSATSSSNNTANNSNTGSSVNSSNNSNNGSNTNSANNSNNGTNTNNADNSNNSSNSNTNSTNNSNSSNSNSNSASDSNSNSQSNSNSNSNSNSSSNSGANGGENGGMNGGENGGMNGGENGGINGGENGGMNGGNNGGDHSVVPESNSLLLFVFAGAGCLAFVAIKRRFASK